MLAGVDARSRGNVQSRFARVERARRDDAKNPDGENQ